MRAKVESVHGTRHLTPEGRSVFRDLFSREEAVDLECRAAVLRGLERWLKSNGLTHAAAAKALGVTRARMSDIERGKISKLSLGLLIRLAVRAGLQPTMSLDSRPTRRTAML
jgi:predicted XRE-type DNA-binding protein